MANVNQIIREKSQVENTIDAERAMDAQLREEYLKTLPATIGASVKALLSEMTDEQFRKCYNRSGDDWVQYEIRCKMKSGEMVQGIGCMSNEVRFESFEEVDQTDPITRWMIGLLEHDAAHIANLKHPRRSGAGAGQYLREGLFCTDNLGDINREFTMAIQKAAGTNSHCRLLLGTDWGSCSASLTLTFPKEVK